MNKNVDFDLIKGCIGRFTRSSIVDCCLQILYHLQIHPENRMPVWKVFVLIKWAYLHTSNSQFLRNITAEEFNALLALIEDFETSYKELNFTGKESINKSFRIIAYQQFPIQDKFHNNIVDRQIVLYLMLKSRYDIDAEFRKQSGIDILSFFKMCMYTYLWMFKDVFDKKFQIDNQLFPDYVDIMSVGFPKESVIKFLSLLTLKKPEEFAVLQLVRDERLQLFESNLFATKPFLLFNNEVRIIYRDIFIQTIKHFIYTYLKPIFNGFSDEFGKRLESYLELGLKENSILYLREKTISKNYNTSKTVDYLVEGDILIEVKAIEIKATSGILRLPAMLTKEFNHSIIKAYQQMLSTANAIDAAKEWFGIILTYRELYLGSGEDAWEEFLKEPITKYALENNLSLASLIPKNVFFIDIECWDYMMQAIKDKGISIKDVLKRSIEVNSNEATKVMLFEKLLQDHFMIGQINLNYLMEANEKINEAFKL